MFLPPHILHQIFRGKWHPFIIIESSMVVVLIHPWDEISKNTRFRDPAKVVIQLEMVILFQKIEIEGAIERLKRTQLIGASRKYIFPLFFPKKIADRKNGIHWSKNIFSTENLINFRTKLALGRPWFDVKQNDRFTYGFCEACKCIYKKSQSDAFKLILMKHLLIRCHAQLFTL